MHRHIRPLALATLLAGLSALPAQISAQASQTLVSTARVPAAAAALLPVSLQSTSLVYGRSIMLGDLFSGVESDRNIEVDRAPLPGERRIYTASTLQRLAQKHGLEWRPNSPLDKVAVERASLVVPMEEVEREMRQALIDAGAPAEIEVNIYNRGLRLHIATDAPMNFAVDRLSFDNRTQRFQAAITAPAGDPEAQTQQVSGRFYNLVSVPVLSRSILPGDIIQERDITWKMVRAGQLNGAVVGQPEEIVGTIPRRPIPINQPIRTTDVKPNILAKRGDKVTLIAATPTMQLTALGIAQESGAEGDLIQVINSSSKKAVRGRVVGPNTVEVITNGHVALN
ncbi:flagellar basal body P-ring formation chaperone FlgA [Oceanibaculum pacificum]|uniref:SAF domain-containing protein n=1 Tax=Oceanibaculum pacificum TaxID=580166 RepID=A0A154W3G7_9PROT|nr:flagellar basal body P-ring formation chaperone FlgA [Oceanibaculum pacificum]KZD08132.1 hypothetical protein AUP43_08975 [Oceanibaculum pacificum]